MGNFNFKKIKGSLISEGSSIIKKAGNNLLEAGKKEISDQFNEKIDEFSNKVTNVKDNDKVLKTNNVEDNGNIVPVTVIPNNELSNNNSEPELATRMVGMTLKGVKSPLQALMVFDNLVSMIGEVANFSELQETNRKGIEANRDIIVKKIETDKDIILAYLDKSFDERKENFNKFFSIVDDAIAKDNIDQLALALDSINKLAASSPFKELVNLESTQKALANKNHIWDF